jgi:predicted LPLAT superfamily acyltransferase
MRRVTQKMKTFALFCLSLLSLSQTALADPVWHCSRSHVQIADASDDFTLAALTLDREVIRISLTDLYGAYQGTSVRMNGGAPLAACVMDQASNLTKAALHSLGAKHTPVKALARSDALVKSNIVLVKDEADMISCITQHHPAIGYLSKVTHTEAVGPCF